MRQEFSALTEPGGNSPSERAPANPVEPAWIPQTRSKPGLFGRVLLLVGALAAGVGFLVESYASYWFATNIESGFNTSGVMLFAQAETASNFLIGVGVLAVGIGWALSQRRSSASGEREANLRLTRVRFGIALVLTGSTLIAGWMLYLGAIEWEALSGVNPHLPDWFIALE